MRAYNCTCADQGDFLSFNLPLADSLEWIRSVVYRPQYWFLHRSKATTIAKHGPLPNQGNHWYRQTIYTFKSFHLFIYFCPPSDWSFPGQYDIETVFRQLYFYVYASLFRLDSSKFSWVNLTALRLTYSSSDVPFQHLAASSEAADILLELQNVVGSETKRSDDCRRMFLNLSKVWRRLSPSLKVFMPFEGIAEEESEPLTLDLRNPHFLTI